MVVCVGDKKTDELTREWLRNHVDRLQFGKGRLSSLELMAGYGRLLKAYRHRFINTTLVDGSRVAVDLVTGITCGLDEQLQKTEELEEKYKQRMSLRNQINDVYLREEKE